MITRRCATTTIYAQAEKRRVRRELAGYFNQLGQSSG